MFASAERKLPDLSMLITLLTVLCRAVRHRQLQLLLARCALQAKPSQLMQLLAVSPALLATTVSREPLLACNAGLEHSLTLLEPAHASPVLTARLLSMLSVVSPVRPTLRVTVLAQHVLASQVINRWH